MLKFNFILEKKNLNHQTFELSKNYSYVNTTYIIAGKHVFLSYQIHTSKIKTEFGLEK